MTKAHQSYPLNDYQQLMRCFSDASPYNAVHFISLPKLIDLTNLLDSINLALKEIGLGRPHFSAKGDSVYFDEPVKLDSIPVIDTTLTAHATIEINRPFLDDVLPLRFFWLNENNTSYLSVTYHHWLADGGSLFRLLTVILRKLKQVDSQSITLCPPDFKTSFPAIRHFTRLRRFKMLCQNALTFSHAYRPALNINKLNVQTILHFHLFNKAVLPQLKTVSRHFDISVNDIFVALLGRMMGRLSSESRTRIKRKPLKPKRDRILVSVIADIRSYSPSDLTGRMNLLLGGYSVLFTSPEKQSLIELLNYTGQETKQIKKNHIPVKSTLTMRFLLKQWAKHRNKFKLFHQKMPISVGISNMNLGHANKDDSPSAKYIRFSPASAMCSLVFSFTHYNHTLSLSIAATNNRYSLSDLSALNDAFNHELASLFEAVGDLSPA